MAGDGSNERADGDGAGRDDRTSAMAADRLTPQVNAAGPVSISQPEPLPPGALAEMEAEALHDVAQIARLHHERLPVGSAAKSLLAELASSLLEDEAHLRLVSPEDSGAAVGT